MVCNLRPPAKIIPQDHLQKNLACPAKARFLAQSLKAARLAKMLAAADAGVDPAAMPRCAPTAADGGLARAGQTIRKVPASVSD
jgi:hypothetical protein